MSDGNETKKPAPDDGNPLPHPGPLPVGDASHIADDVPPPLRVQDTEQMPLTVGALNDHGEPVINERTGRQVEQTVGTMPTTVNKTYSATDILQAVKAKAEPCVGCRFGYYPEKDSQEYREMVATIRFKLSGLPMFMRNAPLGMDPDEYLVCKGWVEIDGPQGRMVHCAGNTCERWKAKKGWHTGPQRRRWIDKVLGRG